MKKLASFTAALLVCSAAVAQEPPKTEEEKTNEIFTKRHGGAATWADYLADTASGSVSASSLLGISGESVQPVENVRDLVTSLKGLSDDGDDATLGISVTPGRTTMTPVSFARYMESAKWRILASTTLSYAQGDAEIAGAKFQRRAASIETSYFFDPEKSDPVVMFGLRMKKDNCGADTAESVKQAERARDEANAERTRQTEERRAKFNAAFKDDNSVTLEKFPPPTISENDLRIKKDEISEARETVINECYDAIVKSIPWNRDRISVMYGTGWIKPKSGGGSQESLGQTAVVSGALGLGNFLFSAIYRKSWEEPVLDTLGTGAVQEKDNELWVGRIEGGSSKIRALVEVSDARSEEVTASQRAFKQAFGLDFRVYEATWVNLRVGRQRTVDGTEEETGSLLSISYSPSALLN